jgi:hypothetical protein
LFPAALFTITKGGNSPDIHPWMKVAYPCNGVLFISHKKEVLIHTITWINLKNIIVSENQTQKVTYYMKHLAKSNQKKQKADCGGRQRNCLLRRGF